jgi:predicted DNA-binding transcriptional regulator YafY
VRSAPIDGEAGLGFLLRGGFFLPPLMFDEDEVEALVLGARWGEQHSDPALARAAQNALAKIATAAPQDLRDRMAETALFAPPDWDRPAPTVSLQTIREAIRREHKLAIAYVDVEGRATERTIWPIALAFYHGRETIAAWCELRDAFRHFRTDRLTALTATAERYPKRRMTLVRAWRREMEVPKEPPKPLSEPE